MVLAQGRPGGAMVLWDFDGTLASTSGDVWGSLAYAAAKRDRRFPFGFEDDDENLALPMSEIFASLLPAPDPADLAGFERDVRVHYRSISAHPRTELYPGHQIAARRAPRVRRREPHRDQQAPGRP